MNKNKITHITRQKIADEIKQDHIRHWGMKTPMYQLANVPHDHLSPP